MFITFNYLIKHTVRPSSSIILSLKNNYIALSLLFIKPIHWI